MAHDVSLGIDMCEICSTLGDDYYTDDKGHLVSACDTCPLNPMYDDDLK